VLREIPLSDFGLETVAQACARMDWAAKSVQNWIRAGLLPAVSVGGGRGHGTFLLRTEDVDAFELPARGPMPKAQREPKPAAAKKPAAKPRAKKGAK
jgi:hypothetical protein